MKKAIVFPSGRGIPSVVDVPNEYDYKWMQEQVGGWIEIVRPRRLPDGFVMIVDEEGLLKEKPLNMVGSWFYETDKHGSPIVGDVLIMKEEFGDEGPECVGMTEEEVDKIFKIIGRD